MGEVRTGENTIFRLRYSEPVYSVAAIDPFNYYVEQADGTPFDYWASSVLPLDVEGMTYEVVMDGSFDPNVSYVVRADSVMDLAGNMVTPTAVAIQPVPEPGVLALGALSLLGVWMQRRRRRAA